MAGDCQTWEAGVWWLHSQGGVQVPTGGEPFGAARGRVFKGKAQIRCKSGADGNSPEERERIFRLSPLKHSPLS